MPASPSGSASLEDVPEALLAVAVLKPQVYLEIRVPIAAIDSCCLKPAKYLIFLG
jgi:hypothetical protein